MVWIRRAHAGEDEHGHVWKHDGAAVDVPEHQASRLLAQPAVQMYTLIDHGATVDTETDEYNAGAEGRGEHAPAHQRTEAQRERTPFTEQTPGYPQSKGAFRPSSAYATGRSESQEAQTERGEREGRDQDSGSHQHKLGDALATFPSADKKDDKPSDKSSNK